MAGIGMKIEMDWSEDWNGWRKLEWLPKSMQGKKLEWLELE
jgi:hypothetical protein